MAALAIIPCTLLAQGIYAGLIGTISTITMNTCRLVKSMYTHKNPDVNRIIAKLDLERRLKLIGAILNKINHRSIERETAGIKLNDLEKTQIFEIIGDDDSEEDPIELCIIYLHEIIQDIHNDLDRMNKKVEYHHTKWFSNWRTLNIKPMKDSLKLNSKLLNSRLDDLTRISLLFRN